MRPPVLCSNEHELLESVKDLRSSCLLVDDCCPPRDLFSILLKINYSQTMNSTLKTSIPGSAASARTRCKCTSMGSQALHVWMPPSWPPLLLHHTHPHPIALQQEELPHPLPALLCTAPCPHLNVSLLVFWSLVTCSQ